MEQTALKSFKTWIKSQGGEILPPSNPYEALRFKGSEVGIIYTSGKYSGPFVARSIKEWKSGGKAWSGRPVSTGRNNRYVKEKKKILKRDGSKCFYCGKEMGEDITLEHLLSLNHGGPNRLGNMVLAHEKCNNKAGSMELVEKLKWKEELTR